MISSVHVDNKEKDILSLDEGPTQGSKHPINFTRSEKRFVLRLHYNGSNSFLFVNATNVYHFKAKDSEIKDYSLCIGNVSKEFTFNNVKKTALKGVVTYFFVDFNPIDNNDIIDIHKYSTEKT